MRAALGRTRRLCMVERARAAGRQRAGAASSGPPVPEGWRGTARHVSPAPRNKSGDQAKIFLLACCYQEAYHRQAHRLLLLAV
jgi:hypothetical protein